MAGHNAGSQRRRKRRIMRALKINEISAVDVPAQEGAVAVIMKRHTGGKPEGGDIQTDEIEKGAALTTAEEGHQHLIGLVGNNGDPVNSGMTTWVDGHVHPWIRDENDEIIIGMAQSSDEGIEPHGHGLGAMSKTAGNPVGNKENTMTDKIKKAADDKLTVEELQTQLTRANAIGALNDAEKAHMSTLEDGAKEDFLAKSAEDRAKIVKVVADEAEKKATEKKTAGEDEDPVAYTTTDGVEIRKSAGEAFVAIAKSNDAIRKENSELRKVREQDVLEKRANDELPNLPGDVATRAAMLKAIDGIEDETQRKAAHDALKAQNKSMAKAFDTVGHGGTPAAGSPDEILDVLAKKHNEANPALTYEQAYDAVMKTAEGATLYAKSVN